MVRKKQFLFFIILTLFSFCLGALSVKLYSKIKGRLMSQAYHWSINEPAKWSNKFKVVEIPSSEDSTLQRAYFSSAADAKSNKPLLVSLHSWSGSYSQVDPLATMAQKQGWNYIHPDFRGSNKTKNACLSKLVITDIDDAIQYAIDNSNVDTNNIFIVGGSGGGYTTLGFYLKTQHKIKAFFSWVPISDLTTWYYQSLVINSANFAEDIVNCTSDNRVFDEEAAKKRSPIYWDIPKTPNGKLEIFAGINDGHEGSVPISQSILFFNRLVSHYGFAESRVDESTLIKLLTRSIESNEQQKIAGRTVLYKSVTPKVSLTIFDGGHEILTKYCFNRLKELVKK